MKRLALFLALAAPAFAQRCTQHIGVSSLTSTVTTGYTQILAPTPGVVGDLHICAVYLSVTQGTTPANFQIKSCNEATCATNPTQNLTPLWSGHASFLDTYNPQFNADTQLPVLRGNGIYLYLSSAPTAAQIQVFYAFY